MKLHWSSRSPFVRKVMIAAHELGLVELIDCVRTPVAMHAPHAGLMVDNPLSKIPTLVLDDGTVLYNSYVILDHLDALAGGGKLIPRDPKSRMITLRRHALGNGFLDLLVLWRNERDRPEGLRSAPHLAAYEVKATATLAALEREAELLERADFDIGPIAIGTALSYMDFRFAHWPWRPCHPRLARWHATFEARPSVQATQPVDA